MIQSRGFSLIELAVALFIIALLLAGAFVPLSSQIDVRNAAETQRNMDSIRDALIGFAQANGRLPCPANGATPAGAVDTTTWATPVAAGAEQWNPSGANTCYTFAGVLPWTTLGVPETDGWGRRFTYRVSQVFADGNGAGTWSTTTPAAQNPGPCNPTPVPAAPASFALCSLGNIAVFTRGGTNTTATPLGAGLPAVVISHGKNGFGGWQTTGIQLSPVPVGNDEAANVNGSTQATPSGGYLSWTYYSRTRTPAASGCVDPIPGTSNGAPPCEFDDIVMMISSSTLIARMVAAGRLP
jgi:prepilin-type N-terminal cleavage/methylation domain-containing protein